MKVRLPDFRSGYFIEILLTTHRQTMKTERVAFTDDHWVIQTQTPTHLLCFCWWRSPAEGCRVSSRRAEHLALAPLSGYFRSSTQDSL